MFYLIETQKQLNDFLNLGYKEAYFEIIPLSDYLHPLDDEICLIYIRPLEASKGYMINLRHNDALKLNIDDVKTLMNSYKNLYVSDLKNSWHLLFHSSYYPIYPLPNSYKPHQTSAHSWFKNNYSKNLKINLIIPLVKHYEACEINYNKLKENFKPISNYTYLKKFNAVFSLLEENPIYIDNTIFEDYFYPESNPYIRSQYNLNTTTSRPTNIFHNINLTALNKTNGERKAFIPKENVFIELDINAYHPTLLANIVGYSFDTDDIYTELGKYYKADYKTSKEITFKQIYGGVESQYKNIPFFQKITQLTNNLWEEFQTNHYLTCPISGWIYHQNDLPKMTPQKLLNYYIQNLETSNNVDILYKILTFLKNKKTRLVLYVYDSFLIDYNESEDLINNIISIFTNKKLKIKIKTSNTYHFK